MDHDHSYKLLFSHPEMVANLLRGFVLEDWVKDLDFDKLNELQEVKSMLAERVIEWTEEWEQQGLQKGLAKRFARRSARRSARRMYFISDAVINTKVWHPSRAWPLVGAIAKIAGGKARRPDGGDF